MPEAEIKASDQEIAAKLTWQHAHVFVALRDYTCKGINTYQAEVCLKHVAIIADTNTFTDSR